MLFGGLQKPIGDSNPLGDVGLLIGPTKGLSVNGNIFSQRIKKKERKLLLLLLLLLYSIICLRSAGGEGKSPTA